MNSRWVYIFVLMFGITASVTHAESAKTTVGKSAQIMPALNAQGEAASLDSVSRLNDALVRSQKHGSLDEIYTNASGTLEYNRNGNVVTIRSQVAIVNDVPFYEDFTFNLSSKKVTITKYLNGIPNAPTVVSVSKKTEPLDWLNAMQSMISYAEIISQENDVAAQAKMGGSIRVLKQTLGFEFKVEANQPVRFVASKFDEIIQIVVPNGNSGYAYTFNSKTKVISISGQFGIVTVSHATSRVEYNLALQAMQKLVDDALVSLPAGNDRRNLIKLRAHLK